MNYCVLAVSAEYLHCARERVSDWTMFSVVS